MELFSGNRIELLVSGTEYFPALLAAIDAAAAEVHLETYIFENDIAGHAVAAALTRAARRGVVVRILVDGFGAIDFMETFGKELAGAGVDARVYRPEISRFSFRRHRLRRLHRKLAMIDARIAFVGGINIIDDMHTPNQIPPRYDFAVRIEGPLLAPIQAAMHRLWQLVGWASLRRRLHERPPMAATPDAVGNVTAAFLIRDNLHHRRDIERAYLEAIAGARDDIIIACAYFLPGRRFRNALLDAAQRGVRVTLLLQGRVEYALLHYASQALYDTLLDGGVRIYEYHKGFLHAKVAVVDGNWATVGSSNIDPFSLLLAREANIVAQDAGFAAELRGHLEGAMSTHSAEVTNHRWKNRSLPRRMLNGMAYSLVRLMTGIAGYSGLL